jgi:DNA-directed RNA polymerase specialized sigma subunit
MADQTGGEEEVRRVEDLVSGVAAIEDPVDRFKRAGRLLAVWSGQQGKLSDVRQQVVVELRAQKVSYRKIAALLGVSLVRVQQIEKGLAAGSNKAKKKTAEPPKESGSDE